MIDGYAEPERDRRAATARLRGVACGVNDEAERAGDEGPFDWRMRRHDPRDDG